MRQNDILNQDLALSPRTDGSYTSGEEGVSPGRGSPLPLNYSDSDDGAQKRTATGSTGSSRSCSISSADASGEDIASGSTRGADADADD